MTRRNAVTLTLALACAGAIPQPAHAQLAVVDVTNNLQSQLHHAAEIAKMAEQLSQMKAQFEQLKKQHEAVTGSYARGGFGELATQQAKDALPGTWQDVVRRQAAGEFGAALAQAESQIATLDAAQFRDPDGRIADDYRRSTDAVRASLASGEVLYAQIDRHMAQLIELQRQIDGTANLKDAQDLNNRIHVENGLLQAALARMTVVNNHLEANQLNAHNRARALLEKGSKRASGVPSSSPGGGE